MYISELRLRPRHLYIVAVSSMEQLIGASLSTIVGIVIPLLNLFLRPELSATVQGFMGAAGLIGIAIGSAVIGPLTDRHGYLKWFRMCAVLIIAGSVVGSLSPAAWVICAGMFIAGFGVGGGYTIDSAYISELMPDKWRSFMVGVAKAMCAVGFILPAVAAVVILHIRPNADVWRSIVWIMGALGVITLIMRLRWAESPGWLMSQGRPDEARKAAQFFFGQDAEVMASTPALKKATGSFGALFRGKNLARVIYSGIPWACEGLGVYGIGVFMPLLVMALGIDTTHASGIAQVINSVELTAMINFCILPGFVIGLLIVNKMSHYTMLWGGFLGSAAGIGLLLAAYMLEWPVWVSIVAFMMFEILLNAGPHLVTYIIPTAIYPVECRGVGSGVADFLGKSGAILGVFFMPMWLKEGGITLVLIITICVMMAGGIVALIFGRMVKSRL